MLRAEEAGHCQDDIVLLGAVASKNESLTERIGMVNQVVDTASVTEEGLQTPLVQQNDFVLPWKH